MHRLALVTLLLVMPGLAAAQGKDSTATDTIFLRAQRLVSEGQGDAGRALVQAQLDAAPTGSPRFVEALYWRAVVGANVADVERDLRRIIIEYPLARRSEDALIRLAQLEMDRGERPQALAHLERLTLERPTSPNRARADYWIARVLFETGELPKACERLADATRSASSDSVELRNQVEYASARCAGVDLTTRTASAATAPPPTSTPVRQPPQTTAAPIVRDTSARPTSPIVARDTSATTRLPTTNPAVTPPATVPVTRPPVVPSSAPKMPATPAPTAKAPARTTTEYTVQVAAYNNKGQAETLRKSLAARGYQARASQSGGTWRVRIGRYATRQAALDAAARIKAKKMAAFVTEAEPR